MKKVEWTEDVKLSDGRMIVVQRSEEYRRVMDVGAGFQRGWLFQRSTITADLPAPVNRKVSWEGSLKPLVLDIQPGNAIYLVCVVSTGAAEIEWKVPRHEFYVAFRLANDGWQRIPLADLPLSVQPNLFASTYTLFIKRDERSGIHIDLKLKSDLDSALPASDRLRTIVRLPASGATR